jgi:hypothetical protein
MNLTLTISGYSVDAFFMTIFYQMNFMMMSMVDLMQNDRPGCTCQKIVSIFDPVHGRGLSIRCRENMFQNHSRNEKNNKS